MKRISFSDYDANHIYEYLVLVEQVDKDILRCAVCSDIKKRLEKFIGEEEVKFIRKMCKKNPLRL